jgi:hypothetical protein
MADDEGATGTSDRVAALRKALTDHGHDLDHFADALGDEGLEELADEIEYDPESEDVFIVCSQDGEAERSDDRPDPGRSAL